MTLHELLKGTTIKLEYTGLDYKEIDRRLKLLDYFIKPFSPELIAEMERQFKELNEQ